MKFLRKIWGAVSTLLIVAVICLAILLVGVRLVGLTPYAVLSGSMEPTYHVGSLIYVRHIAPENIAVGTPITFIVNEDLLLATHRVVEVEYRTTKQELMLDENGQPMLDAQGNQILQEVPLDEPAYYFYTKGDANDAADGAAVHYKNVVGTPVFSIPYLGYLSNWLRTRQGMIMGAAIALALLIFTFLPELLNLAGEEPPKKKKRRKRRRRKTGAAKSRRRGPEPRAAREPESSIRRRSKSSYNNINQNQGGREE